MSANNGLRLLFDPLSAVIVLRACKSVWIIKRLKFVELLCVFVFHFFAFVFYFFLLGATFILLFFQTFFHSLFETFSFPRTMKRKEISPKGEEEEDEKVF